MPSVFMCDGPHGLRIQSGNGDHLGINESQKAICYPTESTVAASFDKQLLFSLGKTLGEEANANDVDMVLGPGVNIKRNPLCGRNFEYYSEDPVVSGKLGSAFIKGLQSTGVSCCVKHFVCNNIEYIRSFSDSRLSEQALREVYLKPFEIIVKNSNPRAIMSSYNLVNGTRVVESHRLLTDILKDEWGFNGIVVSDWGAVFDLTKSIKAGLNLEMPQSENYDNLLNAYKNGNITEDEINEACSRMVAFIRQAVENRKKRTIAFDRNAALEFIRRAAAESQVLLKNKNNIFPISKTEKILVVGEIAINPRYQGGGSSHINDNGATSLLAALDANHIKYDYVMGYNTEKATCDIESVKSIVANYDKVLYAVGLKDGDESEAFDRENMALPICVNELLESCLSLNSNSAVLIFVGAPVLLPWADKASAVVLCGLPGESGCFGVVDVLLGKITPSGKLTETWVKSERDLYTYHAAQSSGKKVEYNEGIFVGYRYYENKSIKPLFAFGHGLSYTHFNYKNAIVKNTADGFEITCKIENDGHVFGKETVFLFVAHPVCDEIRPIKVLLDFNKIELEAGDEREVKFNITFEDLKVYDYDGNKYLPGGEYTFYLCAAADDVRAQVIAKIPKKARHITLYTLAREVLENEDQKNIFNNKILGVATKFFGKAVSNSTLKMLLDMPLKNFKALAPAVITTEILTEAIKEMNEVK